MSGGMNQRVMIAMAVACNPKLLIADEPTTALDVTIQAQIMDLLVKLQKERGMALVLISHDLAVVSEVAQRVAVMYAGEIIETNRVPDIFARRITRTPKRCSRRFPSTIRGRVALPHCPAWCRAAMIARPGACSRRAASTSSTIAARRARRSIRSWPATMRCARCIKPLNVSSFDLTGGAR
jgi:dipeptide transport system ATP-binding protein